LKNKTHLSLWVNSLTKLNVTIIICEMIVLRLSDDCFVLSSSKKLL